MPVENEYWKNSRVVYRRRPHARRALFDKNRAVFLGLLLGAGALIGVAYGLLHISAIQIREIRVEGVETLNAEEVHATIRGILSGDRWHFVPRANVIFFSPHQLASLLQKEYPVISSLDVKKEFPDLVSVTIQERHLWAVYCAGPRHAAESVSPADTKCFYIDQHGVAYREAPTIFGPLILSVYGPLNNIKEGENILPEKTIAALEEYRRELATRAGLTVNSFELKTNSPKDVWVATRDGFDVIAVQDDVPAKVAELIRIALTEEVKDLRSRLVYIDARFGSKLFLKYK